jgi:hypothetical protein
MDLRKDVLFYDDYSSFPISGSVNNLYVDKGTGIIYSWDGSEYVASGTPGSPTNQVVLFADLATTEALKACTYNNGTLGVGATLTGNANGQLSTVSFTDRIDNVVTALNQVILVKNQANQTQNGLYLVTQLGSVSQPFILTRATDADTQSEIYPLQVNVFGGQTQANLAYLQKTIDPIIGTNPIVFTTTQLGIQNTPVLHVDTVTSSALPACTYTSGTNPTLPGQGAFLEANVNGSIGTINGFALINGRRVLIKDQANQAHNGVYVVSSAGSASTKWRLTRVDVWGSNFTVLDREWKVNNPSSTKYGARYSTNLLSLASTNVGITAIQFFEVATPSGVFGIANTSGVYTYYATLTLAMAAATAGQTIEMFADVTETGAVTITLKNGVNINGNGHTYRYTNATGNCFVDSGGFGVAMNCQILNLKIERIAATTSGNIFSLGSAISTIDFSGSYLFMNITTPTSNAAIFGSGQGARILYAYVVSNCSGISINNANASIENCYSESTAAGDGIYTLGKIINCQGKSVSGFGLYTAGSTAQVISSIGISTSNTGINGNAINSAGVSTSGTGIFGTGNNSVGISTSGTGIGSSAGVFTNCSGISSSSSGGSGNSNSFYNCYFESTSSQAWNTWLSDFYGCSFNCKWNNVLGHGIIRPGNVVNCTIRVTNASANCLNNPTSLTSKYSNNSFIGATTPVNANITQGIVNTQDNQGNILL